MRVLIIEDNGDLAGNIGDYLELSGHTVDFAFDGVVGLHLAVTETYDALILDLMLPGLDGFTLCRRLRERAGSEVPILMLTARDTLDDKLKGFDLGADDYLIKPFALEELGARLAAIVKRGQSRRRVLAVADLELDLGTRIARRQGKVLDLNRMGLRLLRELMQASPNLLTRDDLENRIWGDEPPDSNALRTHIYNLRRVLDRPYDRPLLETVHGVGYRLRGSQDDSPGRSE
ncbi:MAG: response regulator transcription factor [Thermoanaerobaculia bacterium]|nr:response regulator transcription factor [Thermoanaerobaculia bacterium]